ncbi:hypothetical protein K505DRAFT_5142 [Melanomma pulvis-pyrius CBS 109.77]|uniref:Uncharacterized protein n=1 Tax=Melanomma pulvis-pyrius CBS 109.77 TaxID=1314802 RepID=A0A6A6WNH5_9PLEO|nr:hypothetical protein K505DRAFT_5142 [Melanomma pulvis-pyrius CBS 109.77]
MVLFLFICIIFNLDSPAPQPPFYEDSRLATASLFGRPFDSVSIASKLHFLSRLSLNHHLSCGLTSSLPVSFSLDAKSSSGWSASIIFTEGVKVSPPPLVSTIRFGGTRN